MLLFWNNMIALEQVESLQLEVSNYCNASCPQCPRNYYGGKTIPTLPLRKWTLSEFKSMIDLSKMHNLKQIYFCGTYGDPFSNTHIDKMCEHVRSVLPNVKIGIHTNGAIGSTGTFAKLANLVDFIAFGIDGLENTNHIYRRNVNWQKLMSNAKAFIKHGGHAIWDYIVFDHNQEQIEQARDLSKQLGFKEFSIKRTGRFLNRRHELEKNLTVYNRNGGVDYQIYPPSNTTYLNDNYQEVDLITKEYGSLKNYSLKTCISCNSKRIKEIYIGADGFVFPCGWLHDRLYGPDVEGTEDNIKMKKMIRDAGGLAATNVFHANLLDIVNGVWFELIEKSWTHARLERCGIMCGTDINLIGTQNKEVSYKE